MKKILLDYLHKRFESPSSKTAKKGVSPASFAIFLRGFLPYLEDFRKFVFGNNAMVSYSNEETGEHWTLDDLETALDTGLTLVASEVSSEQETGAELVMNVAKRGRVAAVLLYAAHFLADSGKKAETEQAKVWLYGIMYERAEDSQEYSIAKALLDSYLNNSHENPIPPEPTDAEWEDYYDKHYASIVDTSEGIVGLSLGDVVHGRADIGNVVIICGWFERLSNIIVKDSYIEAYFAPCLPTWYAIHLLVEKVGKKKLNDLAGERLYRDDIEDEPSPVLLQYPLEGDSIILTHYIQPGSVLSFGYASVIISSTESEEVLFEADEEYDNVWHFSIPDKWDYTSAPVQRRLIRAMKSKIAIIAQMTLPQRCQILLKDHGLPNGQCRVSLIDEYWTKDNAEGGIDITVPFSLIQFPESVVDAVLLSGYDNNEQSLDKIRKRWYDGIVDGYSTTFGSKKLADKKLKFYPDVFFFI